MNLFDHIRDPRCERLSDKVVQMLSEDFPIHFAVLWSGCLIGYIFAFEHEVVQVVKYVETA